MDNLMRQAADHFRHGHEAAGEQIVAQFFEQIATNKDLAGAAFYARTAALRGDFIGVADAIQYGMIPFLHLGETK